MLVKVNEILENLLQSYPQLVECRQDIQKSFEILKSCYEKEGKVLICGNGGSAADCEHIVGELMKGFLKKRPLSDKEKNKLKEVSPDEWEYLSNNLQGALPAISLVSQSALSSAFINDVAPDMVFAQQVYGYAKQGDVLIGITTSGNSKNVVRAAMVAKALGAKTIGMTGKSGGRLQEVSDASIKVPANETFRVQEYHLPVYHALCAMLEEEFFANA